MSVSMRTTVWGHSSAFVALVVRPCRARGAPPDTDAPILTIGLSTKAFTRLCKFVVSVCEHKKGDSPQRWTRSVMLPLRTRVSANKKAAKARFPPEELEAGAGAVRGLVLHAQAPCGAQ